MAGYLFAWNPHQQAWDDFAEASLTVKRGHPILKTWSITDGQAQAGDRAYLIRVGGEPSGILASGTITLGPYWKEIRNPDKAANSDMQYFVDIQLDVLLDPSIDRILEWDKLDPRIVTPFKDDTKSAGVLIPEECAADLEKTWGLYRRISTTASTGDKTARLVLYQEYSRSSVRDIFTPGTHQPIQEGSWESQEIVPIPDYPGDFVFFVSLGKEKATGGIQEGISTDGVLTWQPASSQALLGRLYKQLINHDESLNFIYLFLGLGTGTGYHYLGKLKYVSHHWDQYYRVYFRWQLLNWVPQGTSIPTGIVPEENENKPIPQPKTGSKRGLGAWGDWILYGLSTVAAVSVVLFIILVSGHIPIAGAVIPTSTLRASQTTMPTLVPTLPPTATVETPTLPLQIPITSAPIFTDPFLALDPNVWRLPGKDYWGSSVEADIGDGRLKLVINCPASVQYTYCVPIVTLLQPELKNFDLTFDLLIEQQSANANTGFDFRFRENPGNIFYALHVNTSAHYYYNLYDPSLIPLIDQPRMLPELPEAGKVVTFRIIADNSTFTFYENGYPFLSVEDERLAAPGTFSVYTFVSQGGSATISIRNFVIAGVEQVESRQP